MKNQNTIVLKLNPLQLMLFITLCFFIFTAACESSDYENEVSKWSSFEDVAAWLKTNFMFDKDRQQQIIHERRATGQLGIPTRKAENLYSLKRGYCRDAASFARDALNRIKPEYNARYVFIQNSFGPPHHWATGFTVNKKIFVMDYGAGPGWLDMNGIHGPYDSLEEYMNFLISLKIMNFRPEFVTYRNFPGQED